LLRFGVEAAAVTLDCDGIAWADKSGEAKHFPGHPREVSDVTGAGDIVLAAIGFALAAGADWHTAIELANLAGGLEVQRLGVVPFSREELLAELSPNTILSAQKVLDLPALEERLRERRRSGQQIVMANGCFDLLHPGHLALLQEARKHGDCLVVGVNSDRSVRALKGDGRPVINEHGRAAMLAGLACVDYVVIFGENSVDRLVARLLPDVLVKGSEYTVEDVVGQGHIESNGGRVLLVEMVQGYSTSSLVAKSQFADCRATGQGIQH